VSTVEERDFGEKQGQEVLFLSSELGLAQREAKGKQSSSLSVSSRRIALPPQVIQHSSIGSAQALSKELFIVALPHRFPNRASAQQAFRETPAVIFLSPYFHVGEYRLLTLYYLMN
jgi:hypothetical protein